MKSLILILSALLITACFDQATINEHKRAINAKLSSMDLLGLETHFKDVDRNGVERRRLTQREIDDFVKDVERWENRFNAMAKPYTFYNPRPDFDLVGDAVRYQYKVSKHDRSSIVRSRVKKVIARLDEPGQRFIALKVFFCTERVGQQTYRCRLTLPKGTTLTDFGGFSLDFGQNMFTDRKERRNFLTNGRSVEALSYLIPDMPIGMDVLVEQTFKRAKVRYAYEPLIQGIKIDKPQIRRLLSRVVRADYIVNWERYPRLYWDQLTR